MNTSASATQSAKSAPAPLPVLRRYEQVDRLAMPLGGIGTGTVSLGGRGDLRDWEIMNRPAKGYVRKAKPDPGHNLVG